jgi:protein-L-isoaspartate O-methyltransferase
MNFYAKYVLPRIIDLAMRNKETARLRATWIPQALGEVLEVGIGSGLNLAFYSLQVQRVYGVDPSAELRQAAAPFAASTVCHCNVACCIGAAAFQRLHICVRAWGYFEKSESLN